MDIQYLKKVAPMLALALLVACGEDNPTKSDDADENLISSSSEEVLVSSSSEILASSSSSFAPIVLGPGVLVDDFEDGTSASLLESVWYTYNDADNGAASIIEMPLNAEGENATTGEGYNSVYSLSVKYSLNKGDYEYDPYVGWGIQIPATIDFSRLGGISYWYKGGKHTVRVETSDIKDYDVHMASVKAAREWTMVTVRFKDLVQEGWGKEVEFNSANITAISFQAKGNLVVDSLLIDNLYMMDSSEVAKDLPDMQIYAPQIPIVDTIDVTINNPLQELAMKYLDKGLNITNWLEENKARFKGWDLEPYGEKDIQLMASSGIKALRLPVDLDAYATNRDAFVADTTDTLALVMDTLTLFTLLDSLDVWTLRYGLSLTIDYHEYDGSFNATSSADPKYQAMMGIVWKTVAAHFANSPREDLFYELLNEPGMNSNGKIAQANWTATAQGLIDSIRTVDANRVILFGDVQWYDIDKLIKREPFADQKIIYVIHCYEPFVFTHQGASWGETSTLKNIPFPYDSTKWSTYSGDFGVKKTTASWVKTAVKNYYKTGNKEAIINKVLPAKKWAVEHQVPIILNEFGAYNLRSDAQSRLNYLQAMREMSELLEIPLTHWGYTGGFSLFEDGVMIDGIKEALGF